jgi:zinc protease
VSRIGRPLLRALLGALWLALLAATARAEALDPRAIRSVTLGNGLRVVLCQDEAAPVVSVEIVVRTGSADDPPDQAGMAHLLEHVCWVGGDEGDPRAAIEEVGGVTNAGTLRDFTRFYATVPPSDLARALHALAAMALRDSFDEAVISRERAVILQEAAERMDQPRAALNDLAFETLYGSSHPYHRRIDGDERALSEITSAQLTSFHDICYVPNNMAVIVAGKMDFGAALQEVESIFAGLRPAALPPRSWPTVARPPTGREQVAETALREAYVMAVFVGPAVSEPMGVCSSDVLATILGHPQVGRLVRELQGQRGLVRGVGVDFLTQRDRGLFGVWAICDPDKLPEVKQAIRAELSRLASQSVAPAELAAAKRLLAGEYAFANETAPDRAAALGFYEAIDSYRTASQYLPHLQGVTAEEVGRVAAWYAGEPVWVVMRPGASEP